MWKGKTAGKSPEGFVGRVWVRRNKNGRPGQYTSMSNGHLSIKYCRERMALGVLAGRTERKGLWLSR